MILADVIKAQSPSLISDDDPRIRDSVEKFQELSDLKKGLVDYKPFMSIGTTEEAIWNEQKKIRQSVFENTGSLPPRLLLKNSCLSLSVMCPRVSLANIRDIADSLGFIVTPYEYLCDFALSKTVIEQENYMEILSQIKGFVKNLPDKYVPYVVCPIGFYDINKHIKSASSLDIYAPKNSQQSFMAISMSIPIFRGLFMQVEQLSEKVKAQYDYVETSIINMNQQTSNLDSRIKELNTQVIKLQEFAEVEVARRIEEQARLEEELAKTKANSEKDLAAVRNRATEVSAYSSYDKWLELEPLLIGVPQTANISSSNVETLVGPCWGPDFDDIVFHLLNLEKVEGQRLSLSDFNKNWGSNPGNW